MGQSVGWRYLIGLRISKTQKTFSSCVLGFDPGGKSQLALHAFVERAKRSGQIKDKAFLLTRKWVHKSAFLREMSEKTILR
jgi:hypothetical protein